MGAHCCMKKQYEQHVQTAIEVIDNEDGKAKNAQKAKRAKTPCPIMKRLDLRFPHGVSDPAVLAELFGNDVPLPDAIILAHVLHAMTESAEGHPSEESVKKLTLMAD